MLTVVSGNPNNFAQHVQNFLSTCSSGVRSLDFPSHIVLHFNCNVNEFQSPSHTTYHQFLYVVNTVSLPVTEIVPPEFHKFTKFLIISYHCGTGDFIWNVYPALWQAYRGKGKRRKANPLQAWTHPQGSRKMRLPHFKTFVTWGW